MLPGGLRDPLCRSCGVCNLDGVAYMNLTPRRKALLRRETGREMAPRGQGQSTPSAPPAAPKAPEATAAIRHDRARYSAAADALQPVTRCRPT